MTRYILLSLAILCVLACSDDDPTKKKDSIIRVEAYYKPLDNPNQLIVDKDSKVYVYYNIYSIDLIEYTYDKNGVFTNGYNTISPDQEGIINNEGISIIIPKYLDKKITIVIESSYYTGRLAYSSYSHISTDIVQTNIFEPQ